MCEVTLRWGSLCCFAQGTFIVAAFPLDCSQVRMAATASLFLAILINFPYHALIVREAERDEREKITHPSFSDEGSDEGAMGRAAF